MAVALEQAKGALIYALLKYDFLVLYPVNPKQLAISPSGRVLLYGRSDEPRVDGEPTENLRNTQYGIVLALLKSADRGLTKDTLVGNSQHGDAIGILRRLAKSDPRRKSVISFPGSTGKGYRIL